MFIYLYILILIAVILRNVCVEVCPLNTKDIKSLEYPITCTITGFDNVSIAIIKLCIKYIAEPLSHQVNNSFTNGRVPDSLKIAKVCTIFKSGNNADFTNYRPISVLPIFSKLFEKLVYIRLLNYLSQHSILSDNQYGFRTNHDTRLAVLEMIDKITNARDSNAVSIGIFIDLSKALDTLNNNILYR